MDKYVMVHPVLEEKKAMDDFKDEEANYWSHVIEDINSNRLLFGDFGDGDGKDFDFDYLRLQIEEKYRVFTWAQAREFAETILKLAKQYGESG